MIIYKYLDAYGALETIRGNSVLLKSPLEYNDPFDCKVFVTNEEKRISFELFLNYKMFEGLYEFLFKNDTKVRRFRHLASEHKECIISAFKAIKRTKIFDEQLFLQIYRPLFYKYLKKTRKQLYAEFEKKIEDSFNKMRESLLVCCFGSSYNSILMWSHYADMHKGACLEYEIDDQNFKPVHYCGEMAKFQLFKSLQTFFAHELLGEEINFDNEQYLFIAEPLLTKSKEWEYEGETRCVYSVKKPNQSIKPGKDKNGKDILLLQMPRIKKIYLGYKSDDKLLRDIKEVSKDIPIFKMDNYDGKYELFAKQLD